MAGAIIFVLATIVAQPTVSPDVLEPSVRNEVDHALNRAPAAAATNDFASADIAFARHYATNGLSATDVALRLVTSQRADGTWRVGTNDVTAAAVQILRTLTFGHAGRVTLPGETEK